MTRQRSLRRQLLAGILLPTLLLVGLNTYSLHRQALAALNTAYDRTLLASAKTIGEQIEVEGARPPVPLPGAVVVANPGFRRLVAS